MAPGRAPRRSLAPALVATVTTVVLSVVAGLVGPVAASTVPADSVVRASVAGGPETSVRGAAGLSDSVVVGSDNVARVGLKYGDEAAGGIAPNTVRPGTDLVKYEAYPPAAMRAT